MLGASGDGAVRLADMTWPVVADVIASGQTLALMPVGAIEQHGRHLPLVTDTVIATAICEKASSLTGVPVLPTLQISSSHAHTTKWPGTLSFPPRMVIKIVVELSHWVLAAGFTKLLIVNAHGGNIGPLRVAVDEIRCAGGLQVGLVSYFELTSAIHNAITADGEDVHANSAETSLMLHLKPELVSADEVRDDPDRTIGRVFSYTVAQTSVDGLTGRPSQASREQGERLFDMIITALVEKVRQASQEAPLDTTS